MKKRILGILLCFIMAVGMLPTMAMAQETAPAFDLETDLKDIPILENLVTCICETTGESKTYGQLPEGFTTDGIVIKEDGEWTVIVQIKKSTYLKKFDADTGTKHSADLNYSSDFTTPIQFKMKYERGKWVLDGAMPKDKKLHFTCDNDHENQTPNLPMYPTIDKISGLNDKIVAVLCANTPSGKKSGKYYGLLNGGFTSTMPTREGDMYESTLTLIPSVYCNQYSTDTGIPHTVNPKQNPEGLAFVVKYDEAEKLWMPKEDVKPMGIWVNCDKHETQPQPPETPMYPTIDNISGLDKMEVGVICMNAPAKTKFYGLLNGGFTSTMPTREGDMYESTLTLIPSVYCNQYSTDTGIPHTVNPKQNPEGLAFVVKYDEAEKLWMPKEDVKPMGIWVNCDKHETSTSVTPVYPPSGGGSTIKPGSNGSNQGDGAVVNPDNNQGDNKDKVDTGNKQTGKTKKSDTMEKVPKTGDNTGMTIWLVLLLLSVGALFGTVAFDRKRKRI